MRMTVSKGSSSGVSSGTSGGAVPGSNTSGQGTTQSTPTTPMGDNHVVPQQDLSSLSGSTPVTSRLIHPNNTSTDPQNMVLPTSSPTEGLMPHPPDPSSDSPPDGKDDMSGGEVRFPMAELSRLDDMINRPRWVIPVLPKGELEVLLDASIQLAKRGLDEDSESCQRFYREGLTTSFTKILTDEAVSGWKVEIHVSTTRDDFN